ncbi:MAG: hypothetical protein AABX78_03420 [Nanoarchaeota archaeon]
MYKNKRAIEMAVSILVIVIIALTILGIELIFTRKIFTGFEENFFTINEQLKEEVEEYMLQNDVKLYFPSTEIKISKGGSEILGIGIKNKNDKDLRYKIAIRAGKDQNGNPFVMDNWFQFIYEERSIPSGGNHIGRIKLIMPKDVPAGSYSLTLEILDTSQLPPEDIYAFKDFFVVVLS